MGRLTACGKFLFDGDRKFYARGVSYGPFAPNSRGERYPEPETVAGDFALMRELGANVVRTYVLPPPWLFEQAQKSGLRLMVGMPWPFHMAFLDSREMDRDIRRTIRDGVAAMRPFADAIFAYSLGNEIRSDMVRWHGPRRVCRFLSELYDIGKQLDPDGLFTYSNYPSTEYLDLSYLDLICFNVYLHRKSDFSRYLTHLLAISGDRPLVLSETGMDTIREGEAYQAQVLRWQARAAFEIGLAGFVVFAFTDEWHTGGAEITEWAFGLVTRERARKRAFASIAEAYRNALPPPLENPPKVSVIVAAYNAARTLEKCLESVARLNYPDFETIVVDDGSADSTAAIASAAGAKLLRLEHRGLAAARNAGVAAATGEIVAFIDADACADQDWLYHLAATLERSDVTAAGGPNFPPTPASALAAAIATAPGQPREVRSESDGLAQLCGCNMAIRKIALDAVGGFDPRFLTAGDDVDLSCRLLGRGGMLRLASGAVVMHERRRTIGAYLAQQYGYGAAEGLLSKKDPRRRRFSQIYGADSWLTRLFGRERIYYGAFGRGLFQTVYSAGGSALNGWFSFPLVATSLALIAIGAIGTRELESVGWGFIALPLIAATFEAATSRIESAHDRPSTRIVLGALCFLGPLVRSYARELEQWRVPRGEGGRLRLAGNLLLNDQPASPTLAESGGRLAALRDALVARGLAVATSDGFQAYDLQIIVPPAIRVPLNAIPGESGGVDVRWRLRIDWRLLASVAFAIAVFGYIGGFSPQRIALVLIITGLAWSLVAITRARRISSWLEMAARDVPDRSAAKSRDTGAPKS